ncbi:MAG: type II secretion system protein [Pseudomonadales bacterium]|nr:type II secretion system protein [Pseudomonadales bacterium]
MKTASRAQTRQAGFTLLEVMIALTITGFVLGGLFTLAGGSKQLAWRSQDNLLQAVQARAQINFALLNDEYGELEPVLADAPYRRTAEDLLEAPERKTQATVFALQHYAVENEQTTRVITGSRWVTLELPQ